MRNCIVWTSNTTLLGDLLAFFQYLDSSKEKSIMALNQELNQLGIPSFSIIQKELINNFPDQLDERTCLKTIITKDFISSFDLCFCFKVFNVQRSILYNDEIYPNTVVVKVIEGGEIYNNEWIDFNKTFKFYLFSRMLKGKRDFNLDHIFNKVLLKPDVEIYLFIKHEGERSYGLSGCFKAGEIGQDLDGAKYLTLRRK